MAEAYCVKDKKKVEVVNPQKITMKNGKPAISGTCPHDISPSLALGWPSRMFVMRASN